MKNAAFWVRHLGLTPHPEGGYFKEVYKSPCAVPRAALPAGFDGDRPLSTAIYFLLGPGQKSHLHRLRSDELWHFYCGGPLVMSILHPDNSLDTIRLGPDPEKGQVFCAMAPAGAWFGAMPENKNDFCLVGCTVAPGFAFQDFELGKKADLLDAHPDHAGLINLLAKD